MNAIEMWEKSISKYNKLNLEGAKKLYQEFLACEDDIKKGSIREELINSTLYVVVNHVKNDDLKILENGAYDLNDIISSSIQYFIECIDNGELLEISNFAILFQRSYYTFLNSTYVPCEDNRMCYILGGDRFGELFELYLKLKEENTDVSFELFADTVSRDGRVHINFLYSKYPDFLYNCFNEYNFMYNKLNFDIVSLSKSKLFNLKYLLRDISMCSRISFRVYSNDNLEEKTCFDEYRNEVYKIVFKSNVLSEKEKITLYNRFGFGDNRAKTLEETAEILNLTTRQRVGQIEAKALKKLKSSKYADMLSDDLEYRKTL